MFWKAVPEEYKEKNLHEVDQGINFIDGERMNNLIFDPIKHKKYLAEEYYFEEDSQFKKLTVPLYARPFFSPGFAHRLERV